MNITEKKTVERVEEVVVGKKCDFCGRMVDKHNFFHVTTSHHDWGNDSIDSYEYMDACCPACALEFAEEYIKDAYNSPINTKCIEIKHCRGLGLFGDQ